MGCHFLLLLHKLIHTMMLKVTYTRTNTQRPKIHTQTQSTHISRGHHRHTRTSAHSHRTALFTRTALRAVHLADNLGRRRSLAAGWEQPGTQPRAPLASFHLHCCSSVQQQTVHSWMGPGLSPRREGYPVGVGAEAGRPALNAQNRGFPG